ncbi:MAG: serine protease [Pseudolabrys sp.]|nr:serine protease [Pseudolabrys sp.]
MPFLSSGARFVFALALIGAFAALPARGQSSDKLAIGELLSGIVHVKTFINPDARTRENLGREREGSGVVLDSDGLVLTIGYLMVEAHAAEIVTGDGKTVPANIIGYDHESGFGLLKAIVPLKGVRPVPMGSAATLKERDAALVAAYGGVQRAAPVAVVSKRTFAGNWEYLLDGAIFTSPPHGAWSGAALLDREGKLVGIGSLIVGDATGRGDGVPGNMFVPIDKLAPILADMITDGHPNSSPVPWLGINTDEVRGVLTISRIVPGGPAEKSGLKRGDVVVGVDGVAARNLVDFYEQIRRVGQAGVDVPLDVEQGGEKKRIGIKSMNRLDHLKLNSTF